MSLEAEPVTTIGSDAADLSATELVTAFRAGTVTPEDAYLAVRDRIRRREGELNAFYLQDEEQAAAAARASTLRWAQGTPLGPIDGVPLTVKENIARAGVPLPSGTAGGDPVVPERNAPIVDRILESGGVILGSTTMPDWGMLSSGVSSLHGISRSGLDPALTTGGSSAGAGAAASAGYGPLHVGTDIGGSIRLPGTWLGLATLKPSYGRVPLHAPYFGRCAGPIARHAADLPLFMSVLAQPDDRDYTQLPADPAPWLDLPFDPAGLRVALHTDPGAGLPVDPEIVAAVTAAAQVFADAGAQVTRLPAFLDQGRLDDLDRFWRTRSWRSYAALTGAQKTKVLPFIVQWVSGGASVSGVETHRCYESIQSLRDATIAATAPFDLVLSPVAPMAAFPAEYPMPWGHEDLGMQHIAFTAPYSMSEQPSGTVNCGFTCDGRTIGLQVTGRRFADRTVLGALSWYEAARPASAAVRWPGAAGR